MKAWNWFCSASTPEKVGEIARGKNVGEAWLSVGDACNGGGETLVALGGFQFWLQEQAISTGESPRNSDVHSLDQHDKVRPVWRQMYAPPPCPDMPCIMIVLIVHLQWSHASPAVYPDAEYTKSRISRRSSVAAP